MTTALQTAIAGAMASIRLSAGETVRYFRGSAWADVTAVVSDVDYGVGQEGAAVLTYTSRDFLISAAALIVGGVVIEPARGDRIERGTERYMVVGPGNIDAPCFRHTDAYKTTLRIHTQKTGG